MGGKTIPAGTLLGGIGTDWTPEQVKPFVGQDVRVSFKGSGGDQRTIVGALVGIGRRDSRSTSPPDLCLKVRSGDMVIIGIIKILNITSVMQENSMWDNDPVDLARLGYESYRSKMACQPNWDELTDEAQAAFLAFSEAVRDAVHMGR